MTMSASSSIASANRMGREWKHFSYQLLCTKLLSRCIILLNVLGCFIEHHGFHRRSESKHVTQSIIPMLSGILLSSYMNIDITGVTSYERLKRQLGIKKYNSKGQENL